MGHTGVVLERSQTGFEVAQQGAPQAGVLEPEGELQRVRQVVEVLSAQGPFHLVEAICLAFEINELQPLEQGAKRPDGLLLQLGAHLRERELETERRADVELGDCRCGLADLASRRLYHPVVRLSGPVDCVLVWRRPTQGHGQDVEVLEVEQQARQLSDLETRLHNSKQPFGPYFRL